MKTVPDALRRAAEIYEGRNEVYGNSYKRHGDIMAVLFPDGATLKSPSDFNRFAILIMIAAKLDRYAVNWEKGGHADSLDDISVYAQMLNELDGEGK